jgi:hypothetical protein
MRAFSQNWLRLAIGGMLLALPLGWVMKAEVPPLLNDALVKVSQDLNHWAYTETDVQKDEKGRTKKETKVRFDPSKPYAEQYTPLLIDGKEPTDREIKEYRRKGDRLGTEADREERGLPAASSSRKKQKVSDLVDLNQAVVLEENETTVLYEAPLRKDNNERFPPEKFQLLARVNKASRALENVSVRLRGPLRAKLVVSVKSGDASVNFTSVDPKFAPVMCSIQGEAAISIMFVNVGGSYDLKRTDFQRVKPYGDRFGVQIGPAKALDF